MAAHRYKVNVLLSNITFDLRFFTGFTKLSSRLKPSQGEFSCDLKYESWSQKN